LRKFQIASNSTSRQGRGQVPNCASLGSFRGTTSFVALAAGRFLSGGDTDGESAFIGGAGVGFPPRAVTAVVLFRGVAGGSGSGVGFPPSLATLVLFRGVPDADAGVFSIVTFLFVPFRGVPVAVAAMALVPFRGVDGDGDGVGVTVPFALFRGVPRVVI
jgi:hypothetical protein